VTEHDRLDPGVTRRRFVAGTLAAGAAAAVPASAEAARRRHRHKRRRKTTGSVRRADVAIVGAGLAGLTAARKIVQGGRSVVVLEARSRVGGRVWSHDLGSGRVSERGGTFVGPTQDHVLALMSALGIGKFDTYDSGDNVYMIEGHRGTWSDRGLTGSAPPYVPILPELTVAVSTLDQMAKNVPVAAPWEAPKASEWDGQTLETFLRSNTFTPTFRDVVPIATRPVFGAEPRELSLLFVLFYVASSGNEHNPGTFERNFNTRGGAQMWRIAGGSQTIPLGLAHQLGARVVLSSPVRRILQGSGGVTVQSDGVAVKAKRAIVAIPPTLAGRIDFEPILPFERDQLTQRYAQGTLTKVAAVYDRPFWRDRGLNGQAVDTGGPVSATFDDSPPDSSLGVLFGFVGGDRARAYNSLSPSARRSAVLSQWSALFGSRAGSPRDFFETTWAGEQWTRGCPVGILGPGTLLAYGPRIRQPVGRIHWAGTETSTYWNGYMDGAVRSGERAAGEVLAEL
jgi:monoamine oxidase